MTDAGPGRPAKTNPRHRAHRLSLEDRQDDTCSTGMLRERAARQKYAVIVNEFGETGIDNDLIVGADEEIFEMNNGCICCTVRGDLIRIH